MGDRRGLKLPVHYDLQRTYLTFIAILNPLLTWNCTSVKSIVCIPQENLNLRIPSSRYRYIYMSGVRWAYSKMPVAATVRAVTSMWAPELLVSLWLRYDRLVKAATLIPTCSSHSTPCQPNLHTHCNTMRILTQTAFQPCSLNTLRFEVYTVVSLNIQVLWFMMMCGVCGFLGLRDRNILKALQCFRISGTA